MPWIEEVKVWRLTTKREIKELDVMKVFISRNCSLENLLLEWLFIVTTNYDDLACMESALRDASEREPFDLVCLSDQGRTPQTLPGLR
jgi:hypothetical protein